MNSVGGYKNIGA